MSPQTLEEALVRIAELEHALTTIQVLAPTAPPSTRALEKAQRNAAEAERKQRQAEAEQYRIRKVLAERDGQAWVEWPPEHML